jgi:4-coumarate--CoA ligase
MTSLTSPLPPLVRREQSITERVFEGLAYRPDRIALIDGPSGAALTAAALRDRIERLAGGLRARGVGPGTTLAIFAPNMPDYAVVFHAAALAGATITTLNPSYTAHEVAHQLKDSGASWLFTLDALMPVAEEAVQGLDLIRVVTMDIGLDALMGPALTHQVPVDLDRDVLALPYSSGTTGLPKGVRLSHRNLVANVDQVLAGLDVRPGEMSVAFLPFFHIYGMNVLMNVFLAGGAGLVTMPRFDLAAFLTHVQTHAMRLVLIAPPVAVALAKHPMVEQYDLGSLRVVMSGAAPLGGDVAAAVGARLGCLVMQGYGMTELSPVSHISPAPGAKAGSVGVLLPGTLARIVDPESGEDLGPGQEGELWIKGPQVMLGYHNAPEATARTTPGGWLHTGDLAACDADGHFFIRDRLKELIKVSGFQVAPAEVEQELLACPVVADAAVLGLPDDETGERVVAFIVPQPGASLDLAQIQHFLTDRLAKFKRPSEIRPVDVIPKSASGKILRRVLKAQALAG